MKYNKPSAEEIITTDLCEFGCNSTAHFKFRNGKLCCSKHYNSCTGKRKAFSDRCDHKTRASKSLETRTRLGITKTSQIKAGETRRNNGHYNNLSQKMQEHWALHPWQNSPRCPLLKYKNLDLLYQGSYEYEFLEYLESIHGIDWISEKVARGPSLWYNDPVTNKRKLYISDFLIDNTIYEVKSSWTWNKKGQDLDREKTNKEKLQEATRKGYNVILILDGKEINARTMD